MFVNAVKCLRNNKLYAYRMHGHYHQRLPNCITCNTDNIYRFKTILLVLLVVYEYQFLKYLMGPFICALNTQQSVNNDSITL